jgi:CDGSH-type Zn-finger protein
MPITIKVRQNGSYLVEGDLAELSLIDHEGNPIPIPEGKKGIALCRCGASLNKPFCDATHRSIGFTTIQVVDRGPDVAG